MKKTGFLGKLSKIMKWAWTVALFPILQKLVDWLIGDATVNQIKKAARDMHAPDSLFWVFGMFSKYPMRSAFLLMCLIVSVAAIAAYFKSAKEVETARKETRLSDEHFPEFPERGDYRYSASSSHANPDGSITSVAMGAGQIDRRDSEGCEGGPEIRLIWDVPKEFASVGGKKHRLLIENRSDIDAYHVKIGDVSIDKNKIISATFPEINMLKRNSTQIALPTMQGKVHQSYVNEFEMLYAESVDIHEEYQHVENGRHFLKFPIVVTFKDYVGRFLYRSEFRFTFDLTTLGLHTGVEFVSCVRTRDA